MRQAAVAFLVGAMAVSSPDYSRDALLRVMAIYDDQPHPPIPRNRHLHLGYVSFRALGMDWRVFYLPLAAPLSGSGPRGAGELPNPLKLIGSPLTPTMPPMLDHDRSRGTEREYRRIKRITRAP